MPCLSAAFILSCILIILRSFTLNLLQPVSWPLSCVNPDPSAAACILTSIWCLRPDFSAECILTPLQPVYPDLPTWLGYNVDCWGLVSWLIDSQISPPHLHWYATGERSSTLARGGFLHWSFYINTLSYTGKDLTAYSALLVSFCSLPTTILGTVCYSFKSFSSGFLTIFSYYIFPVFFPLVIVHLQHTREIPDSNLRLWWYSNSAYDLSHDFFVIGPKVMLAF